MVSQHKHIASRKPGKRDILWIFGLLIFFAGCATSDVADEVPAQVQTSTPPSTPVNHVPTPPRIAPVVLKVTPTVQPALPTETPEHTPIEQEVTLVPSPTPVVDAVALQMVGLPGESNSADEPANPIATITAQLEQPISDTVQATSAEIAISVTNTETAPSLPPIPENNKSPLPIANLALPQTSAPSTVGDQSAAREVAAPEATAHEATAPQATAPQATTLPVVQGSADLAWDGVQRTAKVPILMYHYVSTPPADADIYRKDLSVSPELFNAQLDRIQAEGYTTISLYDLLANLYTGAPLPAKPVVITFDDGYRDNYENAFPALKAHGMKATFFVVMEFINRQRPEYMSWDMLREMHGAGMSVEAHGVDHSSLKKQTHDFLLFQALRSYETLQNEIGQRARFISYPAGQYDQNTIELFKNAGYWAGITTVQGATHSTDALFELRRVRVRGTTQPDELARLLATDW